MEVPVTLENVRRAAETIRGVPVVTPLVPCESLSEEIGVDLWLKPENLQRTSSFKLRGATNAVRRLSPDDISRGVITVSAGNHGMSLAFAARAAGTNATIVMPEGATPAKVEAIQQFGGTPVPVDGTKLMENMQAIAEREGRTFIHPFDNPDVIAGQGTVGLEIMESTDRVDTVVVPVGGGGLISGVVTAVKGINPRVEVIGVEPATSAAVSESLKAGRPVSLTGFHTVADGLNAPFGGPNSFAIINRMVDEVITVSDEEILRALAVILGRAKLLVEPAGAASIAGLLSEKLKRLKGKRVVAILSGGNVDRTKLSSYLAA